MKAETAIATTTLIGSKGTKHRVVRWDVSARLIVMVIDAMGAISELEKKLMTGNEVEVAGIPQRIGFIERTVDRTMKAFNKGSYCFPQSAKMIADLNPARMRKPQPAARIPPVPLAGG